ncbi:MAG: aminotransferase class V-fold PLP-dependent enzyme [Longimicrobiales bacterium]
MSDSPTSRRGFLKTLTAGAVTAPLLARAERLDAALTSSIKGVTFRANAPTSIRALRDRYLLSSDLIYLNHASIGTTPTPVLEAHAGYLELCETHPSLYVWGSVWREATEDARARAARLVNCSADDLAITHNTTEGFSLLAHGLPLVGGDEVLFSSINHAGAAVAWDGLADAQGFTVRRFDFPVGSASELTADEVVQLHVDAVRPETRVLVIPHVDNMVGLNHPIREIGAAVRRAGVEWVLVDGAQSVGMIPVDLTDAGVDAYAMSCHKWLQSPKGLGLLYVSPALRGSLPRMWFKTPEARMDGTARDYEDYSTRAWPGVVALGDALAFQGALGEVEKGRRYRALWNHVQGRVDAEPGLIWRSPRPWDLGSMIMAVEVRGRSAPELGPVLLETTGGVVRPFGGDLNALRISPNLMTEESELDRFLDALVAAAA